MLAHDEVCLPVGGVGAENLPEVLLQLQGVEVIDVASEGGAVGFGSGRRGAGQQCGAGACNQKDRFFQRAEVFDVAYLKARIFIAIAYQPMNWLATIIMPRWGIVHCEF